MPSTVLTKINSVQVTSAHGPILWKSTKSLGDIVVSYRPIQFLIKCTNNIACITELCIRLLNFVQIRLWACRGTVSSSLIEWGQFWPTLRRGITLSGVWCGTLGCCVKKAYHPLLMDAGMPRINLAIWAILGNEQVCSPHHDKTSKESSLAVL